MVYLLKYNISMMKKENKETKETKETKNEEKTMIDINKVIKLRDQVIRAIEITEEDKKVYEGDDEAHPALQYRQGMLHCQKDILDMLNDLIIQG